MHNRIFRRKIEKLEEGDTVKRKKQWGVQKVSVNIKNIFINCIEKPIFSSANVCDQYKKTTRSWFTKITLFMALTSLAIEK